MVKIALPIAILVDDGCDLINIQNLQGLIPTHWLTSDDADFLLELAVEATALSTVLFFFLLLFATSARRGRSLASLFIDDLLISFVDRLGSRCRILAKQLCYDSMHLL